MTGQEGVSGVGLAKGESDDSAEQKQEAHGGSRGEYSRRSPSPTLAVVARPPPPRARREALRPGGPAPLRGTGGSPTPGTGGVRPASGPPKSFPPRPSGRPSSGLHGTSPPPRPG